MSNSSVNLDNAKKEETVKRAGLKTTKQSEEDVDTGGHSFVLTDVNGVPIEICNSDEESVQTKPKSKEKEKSESHHSDDDTEDIGKAITRIKNAKPNEILPKLAFPEKTSEWEFSDHALAECAKQKFNSFQDFEKLSKIPFSKSMNVPQEQQAKNDVIEEVPNAQPVNIQEEVLRIVDSQERVPVDPLTNTQQTEEVPRIVDSKERVPVDPLTNTQQTEEVPRIVDSKERVPVDLLTNTQQIEEVPSIKKEKPKIAKAEDYQAESETVEEPEEFFRFMQLEFLIGGFPEVKMVDIKEKVLAMCAIKEREPTEIKFVSWKTKQGSEKPAQTYAEKMKAFKNKVLTSSEKVRLEFNKVTVSNMKQVLEILKKVKVETVEEMKGIAAFVYEKIITEAIYADMYISMVGELKACEWKCEEEKSMTEKSQTCFFGTLMNFAKKRFEVENDWYAEVDVSKIEHKTRGELEAKIEDLLGEKIKKRERTLGNVYFLVALYLKNITSLPNVLPVIEKLLSRNTPEQIIMVCHIYKPLVEKLLAVKRNDLATRIINYLKANEQASELRLQVEIEKALKSIVVAAPARQETRNSFAGMLDAEPEPPKAVEPSKTDAELLKEYMADVVSIVESFADYDEVLEYGDKIYKKADKFDNRQFFAAFLVELVSNYKTFTRMMGLLTTKLISKILDLREVLMDLKEEMPMLVLDFGCAGKNYAELLCTLLAMNRITKEDFETAKLPQFTKHAMPLFKRWSKENDPRLALVASEAEIQKINEC